MSNRNRLLPCTECGHYIRSDNLPRHIRAHQRKEKRAIDTAKPQNSSDKTDEISSTDNAIPSKYAWKNNTVNKNHHFLLPRDIRAIIVGKSGVGKTCLVTYLLLEPGMLDYDQLIVCGKSLHQLEYKIMKDAFSRGFSKNQVNKLFEYQDDIDDVENVIENYQGKCKGGITAAFNDDPSTIPDPSQHDPQSKNLLVLDDCMLGPQSRAEAYYTRGRHNSVDTIYITQSYFRLPRQTIRENANFYIFFPQDNKYLSHIYQDHCAVDGLTFSNFRDFCSDVWNSGKHNFVTIDLTRPAYCGKYRKNFND